MFDHTKIWCYQAWHKMKYFEDILINLTLIMLISKDEIFVQINMWFIELNAFAMLRITISIISLFSSMCVSHPWVAQDRCGRKVFKDLGKQLPRENQSFSLFMSHRFLSPWPAMIHCYSLNLNCILSYCCIWYVYKLMCSYMCTVLRQLLLTKIYIY